MGIYGSKEEIIRFLLELCVADDAVYVVYLVLYALCPNPYDSFSGLYDYLRTRAHRDKHSGFFAPDCTFFVPPNSKITQSKSNLCYLLARGKHL